MSMSDMEKFISEYLKLVSEYRHVLGVLKDTKKLYVFNNSNDPRTLAKEWELLINDWGPKPRWLVEKIDCYLIDKARIDLVEAEEDKAEHDKEFNKED